MTELLLRQVPDAITGLQLLAIACITFTWGLLSVLDAWYLRRTEGRSLDTFAWSLGWFLILSDALVYLILSIETLRDDMGTPLWGTLLICVCFYWAVKAFKAWARGKINGGWHGH